MQAISKNWVLGVILLLAAALRIYDITGVPPSLNWDEVSHGYNAYSILKTGKDEWGVSFPTVFRAYGDYKLPVYIYATSLSEALFGLTTFAVRLPSVVAGVFLILFTYLLTARLFDKKIALLSALLVAVEPWSFFLSRPAFEANLALAFIVSGVYFFLLALEKVRYLPLSALLLGLSVWTYNSARIFVPLFLILLVFLYKKELSVIWQKHRKLLTFHFLLLTLFFIPMFWQLANPTGQARYGWIAILDEGAINQIVEGRVSSNLPAPFDRVVHNKATFFAGRFFKNYLSHFSFQFLFFEGGSHYQQSLPEEGILYPIQIPFLIIGLIYLGMRRDRKSLLVLGWFLLGPVASSLTRDAPHVLRSIVILPIPMVVTSVGLFVSFGKFTNTLRIISWAAYWIFLAAMVEIFMINYFTSYRANYSWVWQYGYRFVADYAGANYNNYDRIIVTKHYGEPHEFFLFYLRYPPERYQNDPNLIRFHQTNWYWVDRFDKFYFVNDWDIPKDGSANWRMESGGEVPMDGRVLLITSPGNYPAGWRHLKTIIYLDGKPAFDIVEKI